VLGGVQAPHEIQFFGAMPLVVKVWGITHQSASVSKICGGRVKGVRGHDGPIGQTVGLVVDEPLRDPHAAPTQIASFAHHTAFFVQRL
jgi:hypothetical protein